MSEKSVNNPNGRLEKRVVVFTCDKEDENNDFKDYWDKIVINRLEKLYGKMK